MNDKWGQMRVDPQGAARCAEHQLRIDLVEDGASLVFKDGVLKFLQLEDGHPLAYSLHDSSRISMAAWDACGWDEKDAYMYPPW